MEHWLLNNIITFGLAFLLTGFLIPQIIHIAYRKNLFDDNNGRKVHRGFVPRLGGVAFVPSIVFAILFVVSMDTLQENGNVMVAALAGTFVKILFLVCSLLLMYLVGFADDLIGIRYRDKFVFQGIAAVMLIWAGVEISNLNGLVGIQTMTSPWTWIVTGVAIIYIVNALNLIDGIDGLAAGLAAVSFIFYGVVLYVSGEYIYSMVAWAGLGALLPFLYFNVFGKAKKRRKIFMGDSGSLTIGMLLAFLAIVVCGLPPAGEEGATGFNPTMMALAPLLIPLLDVARVVWHRIKRYRSPFLPDKTHIHHKLLAVGMRSSAALGVMLIFEIATLLICVMLSKEVNINWIIGFYIIVWIAINVVLTSRIRSREKRLGKKLYD